MAVKKEMDIEIANDGTVTLHVHGEKGSSCLDLTKDLEESLGVVISREKQAFFYEKEDPSSVRIQGENG
jgi:hypothetical protein